MSLFTDVYGASDRVVGAVVNEGSARTTTKLVVGPLVNAVLYPAGAYTANVLQTVLTETGAGVLHFVAGLTDNSTSRSVRIRVTLDGNVVSDNTVTSNQANGALVAVGYVVGGWDGGTASVYALPAGLPFQESCLVEFSNSVSEAGSHWKPYIIYETNA